MGTGKEIKTFTYSAVHPFMGFQRRAWLPLCIHKRREPNRNNSNNRSEEENQQAALKVNKQQLPLPLQL